MVYYFFLLNQKPALVGSSSLSLKEWTMSNYSDDVMHQVHHSEQIKIPSHPQMKMRTLDQ